MDNESSELITKETQVIFNCPRRLYLTSNFDEFSN